MAKTSPGDTCETAVRLARHVAQTVRELPIPPRAGVSWIMLVAQMASDMHEIYLREQKTAARREKGKQ